MFGETFLLTVAHVTDLQREGALQIPSADGITDITGTFSHIELSHAQERLVTVSHQA